MRTNSQSAVMQNLASSSLLKARICCCTRRGARPQPQSPSPSLPCQCWLPYKEMRSNTGSLLCSSPDSEIDSAMDDLSYHLHGCSQHHTMRASVHYTLHNLHVCIVILRQSSPTLCLVGFYFFLGPEPRLVQHKETLLPTRASNLLSLFFFFFGKLRILFI